MKMLRNKNAPPTTDLVQRFIDSAYDKIVAVYNVLDILVALGEAVEAGDLTNFLQVQDIDTLAELNAVLTDATLGDAGDFATTAQGVLAESAIQGPFASAGDAVAGTDNTRAMTALRVAQAIEVFADTKLNNFTAITDPDATNDISEGYIVGSVWINQASVPPESFRCADAAAGAAIWLKTTLTSDEMAAVALTGNSDDLTEGVVRLLLTVAERTKLAGIETGATADMTGGEIKTLYEAQTDTNAFTDTEKTKLAGVEGGATADQSNAEIEAAYNSQVGQVSAGEKTAGTELAIRRFAPKDIADMAGIFGGGGGGGLVPVFTAGNYTAAAGECIFCDSAIAAIQITLPAGVNLDNIMVVDAGHNASVNNITIIPNGVETVDDDVSFIIDQNEGWCNAAYDSANTNWRVAVSGTPSLVNVNDFASGFAGINDQTGTTYEFVVTDLVNCVVANNAAASIYSIPDSLGSAGETLNLYNKGAGTVTIAMVGTDTLDTTANNCEQYKAVTILKIAPTAWAVIGGSA